MEPNHDLVFVVVVIIRFMLAGGFGSIAALPISLVALPAA